MSTLITTFTKIFSIKVPSRSPAVTVKEVLLFMLGLKVKCYSLEPLAILCWQWEKLWQENGKAKLCLKSLAKLSKQNENNSWQRKKRWWLWGKGILEDRSMTSVELLPHNARLCDAAGGMQGRWGQQAAIISTADTVLVITDRRPGLVDTASPATLSSIFKL